MCVPVTCAYKALVMLEFNHWCILLTCCESADTHLLISQIIDGIYHRLKDVKMLQITFRLEKISVCGIYPEIKIIV